MNRLQNRRLGVESLEDRRQMAVAAGLDAQGMLNVVGSNGADTIVVAQQGSKINVAGVNQSFDASRVQYIRMWGLGGNDFLFNGTNKVSIQFGGAGHDLMVGGSNSDFLFGESGSDYILGGDGNDWIEGNDGNDVLAGQGGNDHVWSGAGQDLIYNAYGSDRTDLTQYDWQYRQDLSLVDAANIYQRDLASKNTPNYGALNGILDSRNDFSDILGDW